MKQQSSESSSAASTEDLSEDSSSSGLEDEEEARMEYEMDSKDLCIEIKIAKGQAGTGGDRNRYVQIPRYNSKPIELILFLLQTIW